MERNFRNSIFSTDEPCRWREGVFAFRRNASSVEKNKDISRSIGTFCDFVADSTCHSDFVGKLKPKERVLMKREVQVLSFGEDLGEAQMQWFP